MIAFVERARTASTRARYVERVVEECGGGSAADTQDPRRHKLVERVGRFGIPVELYEPR